MIKKPSPIAKAAVIVATFEKQLDLPTDLGVL